jgi:LuxR family transcriptional regulator, quorum-sensing system regulator BjaR1
MDHAIRQILARAAQWDGSGQPDDAGASLMADLRPLGACMFASRIYWRLRGAWDSHRLWRLNGFQDRIAPTGWAETREHAYICLDHNPLLAAPQQRLRRFLFSDLAPKGRGEHGLYWEAWSRCGIDDGLGLLVYAADGRNASLSIGFERIEALDAAALDLIALVGRIFLTNMLEAGIGLPNNPALTGRERQVMALVARGMTDETVAGALGMSATTARAHVDNARRKLDAANRTEAAALFVRWGLDAVE